MAGFGFLALGLVVGSFAGLASARIPAGKQIVRGRSYCPKCQRRIEWWDNIPVLSFLWLKGKCRQCGKKISARYPAIELTTALGFWGIYQLVDVRAQPLTTLFLLALFTLLLLVFVIDLEKKIIPDSLVFWLLGLIFAFFLLVNNQSFYQHLFSGFLASIFLFLLFFITKGKGMGLGDVKLALPLGFFLGWPGVLIWLFLAFLTGGLASIILLLIGRAKFGQRVAFGPFLVIGFVLAVLFGDSLLLWLFH